jgi:hypothetical protein
MLLSEHFDLGYATRDVKYAEKSVMKLTTHKIFWFKFTFL